MNGSQDSNLQGTGLKSALLRVNLHSCSYEYLRLQFSELRGQLLHLTGKVCVCVCLCDGGEVTVGRCVFSGPDWGG